MCRDHICIAFTVRKLFVYLLVSHVRARVRMLIELITLLCPFKTVNGINEFYRFHWNDFCCHLTKKKQIKRNEINRKKRLYNFSNWLEVTAQLNLMITLSIQAQICVFERSHNLGPFFLCSWSACASSDRNFPISISNGQRQTEHTVFIFPFLFFVNNDYFSTIFLKKSDVKFSRSTQSL